MLFSDFLQIIAVILEVAVTVIAGVIATRHQKPYGWCIAATFGLFVLFDIGRVFSLPISEDLCSRHICLPLFSGMQEEQAHQVLLALQEVVG